MPENLTFSREFKLFKLPSRGGLETIIPVLYGWSDEFNARKEYGLWREKDCLVLRCTEQFYARVIHGWCNNKEHPLYPHVKDAYVVLPSKRA